MSRIPRSLRATFARDTSTFARRWPGKLFVVAVLVAVPAAFLLRSLLGGSYIDDSWVAVLAAFTLVVAYAFSRRLLVTVLVAALVLGAATLGMTPRVASAHTGDDALLARLESERAGGTLSGYRDLAVAKIDLDADTPVRFAGLGADETTRMEVGSLTKAMTGLVIADAVERGEIRLDASVSTYLPQLHGSEAGTVTMRELVTHTAGYVAFGPATMARGFWAAPLGRNFFSTEVAQVVEEARAGTLDTRGTYVYSTLGAATAGVAVAAAAGMSYAELMRTRLFEPLGMTATAVETDRNEVEGGWSASGLPVEPWVLGAYAAGGGVVSTAHDLAAFATALLDGTAPGLSAMDPIEAAGADDLRVGMFWHVSEESAGRTITWHTGQTGGYTTYFGIDRADRTAVVVLSDVSNPVSSELGRDLLAGQA
ncbi:serine hydrolase domain-containing protein [Agromyces bracchium]|uniref:Serine hydrolase n=1 Tax=Agromyces bracchium TaxID=88376 RepID=A0A6I3M956_9MICO|nr:serine hydrolase domain-containing protein [Agromyces bracchium]MTH67103.1 serine hydrolase [Agromyces bracchium]